MQPAAAQGSKSKTQKPPNGGAYDEGKHYFSRWVLSTPVTGAVAARHASIAQ